MNDKILNIRISEELKSKVEKKAKEMNISSSSLIKMIITEYLNKN